MFGLFKKKAKEPEYLFDKMVEYKGHFIRVWAKRNIVDRRFFLDEDLNSVLYFNIGWSIGDRGYYHSGISAERLEEVINNHLEKGKNTIDKIIAQPSQLEAAMKAVNKTLDNIELK